MTADGRALLRAVVERPADDAPRLVYADWLDDHGDPAWAEFIRLQVAAAGEPCLNPEALRGGRCDDPGCRGCRQFRDRAAELGSTPGFAAGAWGDWEPPIAGVWYERGFIEEVSVVAERFVEAAGRLFAVQPIRGVRLSGRMPHLGPREAVWFRGPGARSTTSVLPEPVFDLLDPFSPAVDPSSAAYPTHSDANQALSAACVGSGEGAACKRVES